MCVALAGGEGLWGGRRRVVLADDVSDVAAGGDALLLL